MKRSMIPVALFAALIASVGILGCGGSVKVPTSYQRWNAKDGTFSIDYPDGWNAEGGGKQGIQWAKFTEGSAEIRVAVDVSSSLIGDIAGSANQALGGALGGDLGQIGEKLDVDLAPVAAAHEVNRESTTGDLAGYKEEKAEKFTSKLGEGRKSPFKAKGALGSNIRGYRATVLSHERGIKVLCICPASQWEKLKPAYDKILDSLAIGTTS